MKEQKLILVLYYNTTGISLKELNEKLNSVSFGMRQTCANLNAELIIIPTKDQPTKLECINPVKLSDDEYKEVRNKIKKCEKEVSNFCNIFSLDDSKSKYIQSHPYDVVETTDLPF